MNKWGGCIPWDSGFAIDRATHQGKDYKRGQLLNLGDEYEGLVGLAYENKLLVVDVQLHAVGFELCDHSHDRASS